MPAAIARASLKPREKRASAVATASLSSPDRASLFTRAAEYHKWRPEGKEKVKTPGLPFDAAGLHHVERHALALIPIERIQKRIFLLRGQKVMLSQDLAELYGVPVNVLNQAVRRNRDRFPDDFIFQIEKMN